MLIFHNVILKKEQISTEVIIIFTAVGGGTGGTIQGRLEDTPELVNVKQVIFG